MSIEKEILNYLNQEIITDEQLLDENTLLLQEGIIDSLVISRLIVFLETQYAVKFEQKDIHFKNFIHVKAMSAFIEKRRQGLAP